MALPMHRPFRRRRATATNAMDECGHIPVLLEQIMRCVQPQTGEVAVDCTAGRGGHAAAMAEKLGAPGTLVLLDVDRDNLDFSAQRIQSLPSPPRVIAVHTNFEHAGVVLQERGLVADIVLADLGFASNQMDDPRRGLAFAQSGPLDMRLNFSEGETAATLLDSITETRLTELIFEFGEDPFARRIAQHILESRKQGALVTTVDLATAVLRAYGPRGRQSRIHPATRTFMALRIAVNRELECLNKLLSDLEDAARFASLGTPSWISPNARMAIVSFHSLEDRCIKRSFVEMERHGWATRLTKKPLIASELEQGHNPRARSAKLRAAQVQPRTDRVPGK